MLVARAVAGPAGRWGWGPRQLRGGAEASGGGAAAGAGSRGRTHGRRTRLRVAAQPPSRAEPHASAHLEILIHSCRNPKKPLSPPLTRLTPHHLRGHSPGTPARSPAQNRQPHAQRPVPSIPTVHTRLSRPPPPPPARTRALPLPKLHVVPLKVLGQHAQPQLDQPRRHGVEPEAVAGRVHDLLVLEARVAAQEEGGDALARGPLRPRRVDRRCAGLEREVERGG
jgi:hypothetical protein